MTLVMLANGIAAAPHTPPSDDVVVERLPVRAADPAARELVELRQAVARQPGDAAAAARLAEAYFDLAMARGDPRYVGYADAVVGRFAVPLPPALLTMRALLRQYRHDFDGALADLDGALLADPGHAQAQAWRAAILLVRADYSTAAEACRALYALERPVLHGGCLGLLRAYAGAFDEADRLLGAALAEAGGAGQRLWLLTRLGEVAAWRDDVVAAERHFRAALALQRDDGYLLAAWADFLLDNDRPAEVMAILADWQGADGLLLRRAEAAAALHHAEAPGLIRQLGDRFGAARRRGDTTHRAEEARYRLRLLGDPPGALALASANYQLQREPRDARILLEAAVAAGNPSVAAPARQWLASSGFADGRLRRLDRELAAMAAR